MTVELGKIYDVDHRRKGTFVMRVTGVEGDWITGEMLAGHVAVASRENRVYTGDTITVRAGLATFTEHKE